jgi:hypothetical protein
MVEVSEVHLIASATCAIDFWGRKCGTATCRGMLGILQVTRWPYNQTASRLLSRASVVLLYQAWIQKSLRNMLSRLPCIWYPCEHLLTRFSKTRRARGAFLASCGLRSPTTSCVLLFETFTPLTCFINEGLHCGSDRSFRSVCLRSLFFLVRFSGEFFSSSTDGFRFFSFSSRGGMSGFA